MCASRPLVVLLALALAGCTYVEPEILVPAPDPQASAFGPVDEDQNRFLAEGTGRVTGILRGPAAGLIANNAASLAAGSSAAGQPAGAARYALQDVAALSMPIAGATVALYDASGARVTTEAVSDAEGRFRLAGVRTASRVLFVRATYRQEGHDVELSAATAAPMAGEELSVAVDPATTLVAKKTRVMLGNRTVSDAALSAEELEKLASAVSPLLEARAVVAAAILPPAGAAEVFDRLAREHQALTMTLRKSADEPPGASDRAVAVATVAGGEAGFADGRGREARFSYPMGLAVDGEGAVFVADYMNHRVRRVAPDGTVATIAGDGIPGETDGVGPAARFRHPRALAWHDGRLYVLDAGNRALRRLTPGQGGWKAETLARGAHFADPRGLAVDRQGAAYVADVGRSAVLKLLPGADGWSATTVVAVPTADARGQLMGPLAVAVDAAGALVVADATANALRHYPVDGAPGILAGGGFVGLTDGRGASARFAYPAALAFEADGRLVVVDQLNHAVRRVSPTGEVRTLAGGSAGAADGDGGTARFMRPGGVAVGPDGAVFVADTDNHRICLLRSH